MKWSRAGFAAAALGLATAAIGCAAPACEGDACACPPARQLPTGACCDGFAEAEGFACRIRVWQTPGPNETIGEPGADGLSVVVDANGNGVAAWVNVPSDQLQSEVTVAEERDTWELRTPGIELDGFGNRPSVAAGPSGEALVTWRQELVEDSRVHLATRGEDQRWETTTDDAPLSSPPLANQPHTHISAAGEAFVVFNQYYGDDYGVAIARREPNQIGLAFERPRDSADVISAPVNFSNAPRIATATNGDALITWYQSPKPAGDLVVYASRRQGPSSSFPHPQLGAFISPVGGTIDGPIERNPIPFLGSPGFGGVVWTQRTAQGALAVYLATMDGKGVWTTPASIDDTFSPPGGDVRAATALLNGANELFIVWTQRVGDTHVAYAAHRTADGTFDVPGHTPFVLSDPGAEALPPAIASGPSGETVVAWSQQLDARWHIRARIRHAGDEAWSTAVTLSTDETLDAVAPDVGVGPDGRAVVGWLIGPAGNARVQFASL